MTFWLVFSFHHWIFLPFFLSFFHPFIFFGWIFLHSFQGGKPAAGTNFPVYLIFPPCPKQLLFPMLLHEKQPCQLFPGALPCTLGCLMGMLPGQVGRRLSPSRGGGQETSDLPLLPYAEILSHFLSCFFLGSWKTFSGSHWLLLLSLSLLQERASSVLSFKSPLLRSCHFKEELVWLCMLQLLSALNL